MNRLCEKLFARSAGPLNEDCAITFRDVWKDIENLMNQMVFTNDVTKCVSLGKFLFEFFNCGEVPEGLNTTDDLSLFVP